MSDESVIRQEKTEFSVGLFILVGITIMGTMIWQFGSVKDRFTPRYRLELILPDATGIIDGAQVRLSGVKVGSVVSRDFLDDYGGIKLRLDIYENYLIPEKSQFGVATSGLMGDKYINITPPKAPTGSFIAKDSTINASKTDVVADLTARATALSDQVTMVLEELDAAVSETRVVVENLTSVSEKLDRKVMSDNNVGNFTSTLEKLSATTDNLAIAAQKLTPLIDESRKTVETAAEPFEEARSIIEKLDVAISDLNPALAELEPAVKDLRKTINNADEAIDEITDGDGLFAALVSDEELKRDIKSLVANLEKHGVLGYKKGKRSDATEDNEPEPQKKTAPSSPAKSSPARRGMFGRR